MLREMMLVGSLAVAVTGCSSETSVDSASTASSGAPSAEGARYLLTAAPADPQDVIAMRQDVADEQEVTVIGRIGGSHEPWVDGMAAFSLVDRSLAACSDIPGDGCPTPWDYCCETDKLPGATTLVKVVDERGELLKTDAREMFALKPLQTITVQGKAKKDEAGNVTILASAFFVDPSDPGQLPGDGGAASHDHDHDHDHDADHDDHGHDHDEDADDHDDESAHNDASDS